MMNLNPMNFMQQLNQFANNYQGDGNQARQEVQDLMSNGKLDQQTYGYYSKIAQAIVDGNPVQAISLIFGSR